ncbi:MAG: hypothetical protein JWN30_522 [Bacilli bacterium]|nr:hypothetical protein [Bacilli bacterium]
MDTFSGILILQTSSQTSWEEWLENNHHTNTQGVWLKIAKKNAPIATVTYVEAIDAALCFGWIDGQKQSYDQQFYLQKFTPRRAKSVWSKKNVDKITQLIESGKMRPSGLQEVEAAKQDGRWNAAYESQRDFMVQEDFQAELDKNLQAKAFYATLNKQNRFAIYFRINSAKKPETRNARIRKFITMLTNEENLYL